MSWCTLLLDGRLQWETLLTGIAAIGAAWWAISATRRQEDDQRRRRARASRVMLPSAILVIGDYAVECMVGLNGSRSMFSENGVRDDEHAPYGWTAPKWPDTALPIIRDCVEFEDGGQAEALETLVLQMQIQYSRLKRNADILSKPVGSNLIVWTNVRRSIQDSAETYARSVRLLLYARHDERSETSFDVDEAKISSALHAAGLYDDALLERWTPTMHDLRRDRIRSDE